MKTPTTERARLPFRTPTALASLGVLSLAPLATAAPQGHWQAGELRGMYSAFPVAVLELEPGGVAPMIRESGEVTAAPSPWSSARFSAPTLDNPDFSPAALLAGLNRGVPSGLETASLGFGSFSTGGDVTPTIAPNALGAQLMLDSNWYSLSCTIAERSNAGSLPYGAPGTTLRSLDSAPGAVISHYEIGSTGISPSLIGMTALEQTTEHMGFASATIPQLAGLDWAMGTIASDPQGGRSSLFAPVRDSVYFSLSKDWLADPANANYRTYQEYNGLLLVFDAATVYRMTWEDTGTSIEWSAPEVAYSAATLFGPNWSNNTDLELDALSVYRRGGASRVVLSTTLASGSADQVLAYDEAAWAGSSTPYVGARPLIDSAGNLFSDNLGIHMQAGVAVDEVNGLCGKDPEIGLFDGAGGTATIHAPLVIGPPLGLSVFRAMAQSPASTPIDLMHIEVTGLGFDSLGGVVEIAFGFPPPTSLPISLPVTGWNSLAILSITEEAESTLITVPGDLPFQWELQLVAISAPNSDPSFIRSSWVTAINY
ncbi:MAG: hypothetical protein P1V81_18360 [Planctomycetota bacterium]|nr:hypothetical protein [Planctomycetota bacterium]